MGGGTIPSPVGEATSLTKVWFREGKGGGGLTFPAPVLVVPRTPAPAVSLLGGVAGTTSRSSGLAPGILPTRFGGGANVLTSLVSIVAKCRDPTFSSSFFPEKGTEISF